MSTGSGSPRSDSYTPDNSNEAWVDGINILPNSLNIEGPYVEIHEQPQERGHRFRYKCEGKSHGVIKGERSDGQNRTFPSIRICGYRGPAAIRVSLVTESGHPHDHELTGPNTTSSGTYEITADIKNSAPIQFKDLSILHVTQKDARMKRMSHGSIEPENTKQKKNDKKAKVVKLMFTVTTRDNQGRSRTLNPVISNKICDGKGTNTSELRIKRLSKHAASSEGGEEVFLLCDKVNKEDIEVKFYEHNAKGQLIWESKGEFGHEDVHYQVVIVFKTPRYLDAVIGSERNVFVQLKRPTDGTLSDAHKFTIKPAANPDMESIEKKRKKAIPPILNAPSPPAAQTKSTRGRGGRKTVTRKTTTTNSVKTDQGTMRSTTEQISMQMNTSVVSSGQTMVSSQQNASFPANFITPVTNFGQVQSPMLVNGHTVEENRPIKPEFMESQTAPQMIATTTAQSPAGIQYTELQPAATPNATINLQPNEKYLINGIIYESDERCNLVQAAANTTVEMNGKVYLVNENGGPEELKITNADNMIVDFLDEVLSNPSNSPQHVTNGDAEAPMYDPMSDFIIQSTAVANTIQNGSLQTTAAPFNGNIPVSVTGDIMTDDAPVNVDRANILRGPNMNPRRDLASVDLPQPEMFQGKLKGDELLTKFKSSDLNECETLDSCYESMPASMKEEIQAEQIESIPQSPEVEVKVEQDRSQFVKDGDEKKIDEAKSTESKENTETVTPECEPKCETKPETKVTDEEEKETLTCGPKRDEPKCETKQADKNKMAAIAALASMKLAEKWNAGLQYFAQTGDIRFLLVLQRYLIDVPDGSGDNAIHIAVINKQVEPLRHLLTINQTIQNSTAINAKNDHQQTPLHLAVVCQEDYMVELLMEYGARLNIVNALGYTALQLAAKLGLHRCVLSMLTKCKEPATLTSAITKLDYDGLAAIHLAVLSGNLRCVEHLVGSGADVNIRDGKRGYTPLHLAVEKEFSNIVGYLLMQASIQPDVPSFGDVTALHIAVSRENLGIAAALVSAGADPEAESAEPLESDEEEEVVEQQQKGTQENGCEENDDDEHFLTPIHIAMGNHKMMRILKGEKYSDIREDTSSSGSTNDSMLYILDATTRLSLQDEGLSMLDIVSRKKLVQLLEQPRPGADWEALAQKFKLGDIVEFLRTLSSPTLSLLDNLEAMEISVNTLRQKLIEMDRMDAANVIEESLQLNEHVRKEHKSLLRD